MKNLFIINFVSLQQSLQCFLWIQIKSEMRFNHQPVLTEQTAQNVDIYQEDHIVQNNNYGKKISVIVFILAILIAGGIFQYEEYQQIQYEKDHQPRKQDVLKSQSMKRLQDQEKQKQLGKFSSIKQPQQQKSSKELKSDSSIILLEFKQIQKQANKHIDSPSPQQKNHFNNKRQQTAIYKLPIQPQLAIPQDQRNVTVVITTCCNRYDLLQKTINSFIKINTYTKKLTQIIIINDGPTSQNGAPNKQFQQIKQKWKNFTWIQTYKKVGQIQSIDIAYRNVKTPFVFHCQDDWIFLQPGFIEISFDYFQRIPKLLQTWIKITKQQVDPKTRIVHSIPYGFSFNPGLKKMEHYNMLNKGYKWITKDISNGMGAGKAEGFISRFYKRKGFVVAQTQLNYIQHIGQGRGLPRAGY